MGQTTNLAYQINFGFTFCCQVHILKNLDAAVECADPVIFRGVSECDLISLALSFHLLCKTLFFIQGEWEGIRLRKVFALSSRTDS